MYYIILSKPYKWPNKYKLIFIIGNSSNSKIREWYNKILGKLLLGINYLKSFLSFSILNSYSLPMIIIQLLKLCLHFLNVLYNSNYQLYQLPIDNLHKIYDFYVI